MSRVPFPSPMARPCAMQRVAALALLALAVPVAPLLAQPPRPPAETGIWYDDTGKGAVEIMACGKALCGHIVWLKDPLNAAGKPLTDKYNPEPTRRGRAICGLQVLGGLQRQDDGTWDTGWVYDPKEGKSYDAAIEMAGPDKLAVTGYLGVKLFSRTLSWTRAPANLPRCAN